MSSGRAWNISTGFSTPFLDVDYRVKYRQLMRVHFLPDGSACGYEAISHPDWRVCEARESGSEIGQGKISGLLQQDGYYNEDEKGKIFDSPVGAIRMNHLMCSIADYDELSRVAVVVDVKDGAHDQMELEVYVFKLNKFISFPHFNEYSFIRLRLNGVINMNWVSEEDRNEDNFLVDHLMIGLVEMGKDGYPTLRCSIHWKQKQLLRGFSTSFLNVDYRLKYRMRVHFSPDGSACGFESVNHPNWRVYEGRLDSEIEKVKMTGILDMRCNYHEDGKFFNSPVRLSN
ncbi:hypothetical protein CAEBREN_22991 [Caenorhabditis brenneri]|uniref:Uncharacterized protein n=1 Tax=Caenorhabditis brenneri TaxID=135651 RepID=G0PFA9_CAEBE|nr:hypothetical protein CAEBREN_22991 [Caenorhabditis brenneri]